MDEEKSRRHNEFWGGSQPCEEGLYARLFMNEAGLAFFEKFKDEVRPNSGNLVRHRLIDDLLRAELARDATRQMILIFAGEHTMGELCIKRRGGSFGALATGRMRRALDAY